MSNMLYLRILSSFVIVLSMFTGVEADLQTISTIIDTDSNVINDFIQIKNPPETLINKRAITIEYKCSDATFVGVEVVSKLDNGNDHVKVFKKRWVCPVLAGSDDIVRIRRLKLRLPATLAYNYNVFNARVTVASDTKLRAWIVNSDWWDFCKRRDECYSRSRVKVSYASDILPPYSRPFYRPMCRKWSSDIRNMIHARSIPTCEFEQEVVQAIEYPVVLGGLPYGVYRQFLPYTNPVLEQQRQQRLNKPRFTVAVWLYILEYCPGLNHEGKVCGVMFHFNWKAQIRTFMLMLKPEGDAHIQVQHTDENFSAGRTNEKLPLKQWIRIVVTFNVRKWNLVVNYGEDFKNITENSFEHPGAPVYMDDTEGLFTFGGGENFNSFRGYIGEATIYRNKIVRHSNIPYPSRFHPMFELNLSLREKRCHRYMSGVEQRIFVYKHLLKYKIQSKTCRHIIFDILMGKSENDNQNTCRLKAKKQRRHWAIVDAIVKKKVYTGNEINVRDISNQLYVNATYLIEEDVSNIPQAVPILKQAACYGNNDAMFMLSVILNNGLFVKSDEIQSQAYLMLAALDSHRLSELALGHKHRHGLDGMPIDFEQSFKYHKYVADTTSHDKQIHRDTDVFTESIRLTDELALKEQTDEDGDIFHWLKHQAKQGVASAQTRIGRLLYWGSHGLKRNLADAMEYFKMSAETGDAQSQYDYGIVLIRGQGTEKDVNKGLEQLNKAAKQHNDQALNALGWHAREFEKDDVKAADYFELAYRKGNVDAAYNLGMMHFLGHYPGQEADMDKAMALFAYAAQRGQLDAGVAFAHQSMRGTSKLPRDMYMAAEWARFIAEKNPAIGYVLRKATKAYRDWKTSFLEQFETKAGLRIRLKTHEKQILSAMFSKAVRCRDVERVYIKGELSLVYYAMAADAGLEVGSFNMAWLCEENKNGITSFIEKECQWRNYNLSTLREPHFVDSYALIKMGDYYWYGCKSRRDTTKAANYYADAAAKNNPQAIFNVAFMIEEGVDISPETFDRMRVPRSYLRNNVTLLDHLYTRCKDSRQSEAYIPCSIALWRLHIKVAWTQYQTVIKIASFTGVLSILSASSYVLLRSHLRPSNQDVNTI